MRHLTFRTIQTKKRVNSKQWDFSARLTIDGVPQLMSEPKKRGLDRIILNIPDDVSDSHVFKLWDLVDMTMTPLFFTNTYQLGCEYEKLVKETQGKLDGKTNYASIMVGQLSQEFLNSLAA